MTTENAQADMVPTSATPADSSSTTRTAQKIAVVDLSDLRSDDAAKHLKLGQEVARACSEVGFFYIVGHGIPESTMKRMFALADEFFRLQPDQKAALSMAQNDAYRGYLPMKTTGNDPSMKGLLLDAFHVWCGRSPGDAVIDDTASRDKNPWPPSMPGMQAEVMAYAQLVTELARDLIRIAALGIGVPEDTFLRYFDSPLSLLRFIHYPPQEPSETEGRFGTRPHTDNCAFTLLAQDDTGGLEILGEDGEWIGVAPIPGSYVINLGEVMKIWTNGMFMATPHRVINRSGRERFSIPFFMNPTHDAVIRPLIEKTRAGAAEPLFHTTVRLEEGLTSGEILMRLYKRIWPSKSGQLVS